ncbi:MAG: Imm39 family immunity protein [Pseudomonadota bacterium]
MGHNRKFVPSGIAIVEERMQNVGNSLVKLQNKIEEDIVNSSYLDGAPFTWIGMNIRFGHKNKRAPWYQGLSKKYGDLTIAIEINADILIWADRNNVSMLDDIFTIAALEALIHVGKKYHLKTKMLEKERSQYRDIPNSLDEIRNLDSLKL